MSTIQHKRFDDLTLSTELQQAVASMGFEDLTPIQSGAIPLILDGKDIIGQAQTGTGKTLAFGIPMLELLAPQGRKLEGLVLCPTRELAVQVAEELKRLARYRRDVHIVPVYGGQPIKRQLDSLKRGARIVVGTPGRIMDHMNRGTLIFDALTMVVLDEADRMLDMGFVDDMKTILWAMPEDRQTLLFSATIPHSIMALAQKFQRDPHVVNVAGEQLTVPQVEQAYCEVKPWMKLDVLCWLIDTYKPASCAGFLQHQAAGGQDGQGSAGQGLWSRQPAWRHVAVPPRRGHAAVPHRTDADTRGDRRGCPRPRCAGDRGGHQLRPAAGRPALHPPDRQDRADGAERPRLYPLPLGGARKAAGDTVLRQYAHQPPRNPLSSR